MPISLVIAFLFISCNKFDVDEAVDRSYLDEPAYRKFRETSRSETGQSIKDKKQLAAFVKEAIKQQSTGNARILPFTIDKGYVDRILTREGDKTASTVLMGERQRFFNLMIADAKALSYHFFMLCKVSAYQNCAIGLAITDSGEVADLSILAPFKRMLTYAEIPTLNITPQEITIEIKSRVEYPIKQENVYNKRYLISEQGYISEAESD